MALQPVLGGTQAYALFYPAIVLVAYLFGRRPGAVAVAASAVIAFSCFSPPQFAWKAGPDSLTTLFFFTVNSSVAVYLIGGLRRALEDLAAARGRALAVANSHADLFRELNDRISHHLRLVAGVLALQAKGEPEPDVMRGLQKASERSALMARVHRELSGDADAPVNFGAFASGLARSVCLAHNAPEERVRVEPVEIWLAPDEATSLGVALVECIAALLARKDGGAVDIRMATSAIETRISISEVDEASGVALVSLSSGFLLRAMVEQLGAALSLRADGAGSALELAVPHAATLGMRDAAVGTLH